MAKDCWTALELHEGCKRLAGLIGPNAEASFTTSEGRTGGSLACVGVYPTGLVSSSGNCKHFFGDTIPDVFAKAEKFCSTYVDENRHLIVRRMALAIIDITDRLGACSDLNLKAEKFSAGEIASYHIDACEAASRMSGNAPFTVVMSTKAAA